MTGAEYQCAAYLRLRRRAAFLVGTTRRWTKACLQNVHVMYVQLECGESLLI
eukprot:COSAG01_NODE_6804_length_3492_cov_2.270557_4_plen_52_part_00